jgi:hypothetical protein
MAAFDLVGRVSSAMEASELLQAVRSVSGDGGIRFALGDVPLRSLTRAEVDQLEAQGNSADDWSRIRVADGFDAGRVRHSSFHGDLVFGRFADRVEVGGGLDLPTGIHRSTVANCVVGHDASIRDVKLLVNYVVAPTAVLHDCGTVACDGRTAFGNGQELPVAIETGGRDLRVYAEIDVEIAAVVARSRGQRDLIDRYAKAVDDYTAKATSTRGIIDRAAVVRGTPAVRNVYLGPHARVDGATLVSDSTLLSNVQEPAAIESGACVKNSLLQWGSHVATLAIVDGSVLTEHSHVERHGIVTGSILGPNTGVAEGEVTASLLGPFVGFHHQALLIAALWPEGKGNVGYGANVGSNHTGKAPDQEFWPGEGTFLGLGVNIKYPADLSRAPYTIIATGVTTLPQKVTFPFSLVNSPAVQIRDISPAYNEILPAWVLSDNLYAVRRNEAKFQARNKARRTTFQFTVFRPDTVDLMVDALRRLETVRSPKPHYTDRDIEGLGKNFMLESSRVAAINTYRSFIRYYALTSLKRQVESLAQPTRKAADALLRTPSDDPAWEHARRILYDELGITDSTAGLDELPDLLDGIARSVERSKAKDDERGGRIIDDYAEAHKPAAQDSFVRKTYEEMRIAQDEVRRLGIALR